jgi:hypothetical protein
MLYKITIGNYLDDSTFCKLALSFEDLTEIMQGDKKYRNSRNFLLGLEGLEFIVNIEKAEIFINAWDEQEYDKLKEIENKIFNS